MPTVDPKNQAEFDQHAKLLADNIPSLLWGLYQGFLEAGFNANQAQGLCETYIEALVRRSHA